LDFPSVSSLKQQGKHITPIGHINLIPSQQVFALSLFCCVPSDEEGNINVIDFGVTRTHDMPH